MADCMDFPEKIEDFLLRYCFKDEKEIYSNGSMLIPMFRVQQALEHYGQEIKEKAIDDFAEKLNKKITDFVLEHKSQLTFVSGVSMAWKFVDEIAEQLKGGNDHEQNYQGNT